jgi:hypothetical protein
MGRINLELTPGALVRWLAIGLGAWLGLAGALGPSPAAVGEPEIRIWVLTIEPRADWEEQQLVVAEIANDLLPPIIEKVLSGRFERYVWAERLEARLPEQPDERAKFLSELKDYGIALLLEPEIAFGERGLVVRTTVYDFRLVSRIDPNMRGVAAAAFMSPGADFGEIEQKLFGLAEDLAELIVTGRTAPPSVEKRVLLSAEVLVGCVQPANREDPELVTMSRRLTLELPYFLSQTSSPEGVQYSYAGLGARDFFAQCISQRGLFTSEQTSDVPGRQYDFELSGDLYHSEFDYLELVVYVDSRMRNFAVPLPVMRIPLPLDEKVIKETAERLSRELQEAAAAE